MEEQYIFNPKDFSHQGVKVGIQKSVFAGNHIYVSTDWQPDNEHAPSYGTGTFMSADDAENLATILMYYAKLARDD